MERPTLTTFQFHFDPLIFQFKLHQRGATEYFCNSIEAQTSLLLPVQAYIAMHKDFPFKSNLLLKWTLIFRGLAMLSF